MKTKPLTKKELKRFNEIEQSAIGYYLDKTDFDIAEWIDKPELTEWRQLKWKDTGECPTCGETIKSKCECN